MTSNDIITLKHGRCPACNKTLVKITPKVNPGDRILSCPSFHIKGYSKKSKGHIFTRQSVIMGLALKFHFYVDKPVEKRCV